MPPKKDYIAVVGLSYPTAKGEVSVEAGQPCPDLPAKSVSWLREQGLVTTAADIEKEAADGDVAA